ncbi:poly(A)-binding protein binding protein [Entomophthora muscae]|uniref:Poly(A)-binding protein binding protein n=1 Tax=Entomophthora muscae TaxID=34485 RepID=A0ACC2UI63_9FUNG|nr:poly(A)-binding protein binding protein [Entomophthora muscae]
MAYRGNRGGGNSRNNSGKGFYGAPRGRSSWSSPKGESTAQNNNSYPNQQNMNHFPPPQHRADVAPAEAPQASSEDIVAHHMHDRFLYLFALLLGNSVEVTTQTGDIFQGLLHGCSADADLGVVLKMARLIHPEDKDRDDTYETLAFPPKDIVGIAISNFDLTPPVVAKGPPGFKGQGFNTDTGISGHSGEIKERELERWVPDKNSNIPFMSLEDTPNQFVDDKGKWDQFAANESLFNVTSNYDELIYTTAIDRSVPNFKESEKVAARLANEILNKTTNNAHMAEERGQEVAGGMDEEDKYSSVARPGKYMAPAARSKPPKDTPAKTPEVADAKPKPMPGTRISQKKADAIFQLFTNNTKSLSIATQRKLYGEARPNKPIEEELMGTFRQFVSTEKERLQQTKQTLLKKDKDGKVAELVKFSKSFKLNTPVPDDIKALISKDTQKATDAETSLPSISEKPETETSQKPKATAAKLNVNASEFKPNPAAKPFTPSSEPKKDANAFFTNGKPTLASSAGVKWLFSKSKEFCDPSTLAPTWPTEGKPYTQQFIATPVEVPFPAGGAPPAGQGFGQGGYYPAYRYPNQMPYSAMPPMNMPQQMPFMGMASPHPPPYIGYPNPGNHPSPSGQMYYKHPSSEGMPQSSYPGSPGRPPMYAPPISHSPMMMPPLNANGVLMTPRPIMGDGSFQHMRPMPPPTHHSGPPQSHPMPAQSPQIMGPAFHPPPPQHQHGSPQHHQPMYPHYPLPPQHYPAQPQYNRSNKSKGRSNHDKPHASQN